jgi:hypothetical protein
MIVGRSFVCCRRPRDQVADSPSLVNELTAETPDPKVKLDLLDVLVSLASVVPGVGSPTSLGRPQYAHVRKIIEVRGDEVLAQRAGLGLPPRQRSKAGLKRPRLESPD